MKKTSKPFINFVPAVNHFFYGQWRKGISDVWNVVELAFSNWHVNKDFDTLNEQIRTGEPTSREYADASRKLKQFKELKNYFRIMVLMNYINSVIDAFTSENDKSFLGVYFGFDRFYYDSYVETPTGYESFDATRNDMHWGFNFGCRNAFEYYANIPSLSAVSNNSMMFNMDWYTDYIIPYKFKNNLDFYIGLGFNQIEFHNDEKEISTGGCGLGFYPRFGASYLLKAKHYFRLNLVPYILWGNVKFSDPAKTGVPGEDGGHERTIERGVNIDIDKRYTYMRDMSFSLNYAF